MVNIVNESIEEFLGSIETKNLYVFGAGRRLLHLYETLGIRGRVIAVVDNNEKLWNTSIEINGDKLPIININDFMLQIAKIGVESAILLITPAFYSWKIVEQLDDKEELNGLKCYISGLLMEYYKKLDFSFSNGEVRIPRKIHYCWFGQKEIPLKLQKYIDTWKQKCPDYEIIRWDEHNYDVSKNRYMKEAYECGKWGFVPDYARLDIVYQEGGIYLDTDVELLQPLDKLLYDEMFCCADSNTTVNFGVGFGGAKGNKLIKELRDYYDDKTFINEDGTMNVKPCYMYQNPVLAQNGFEIKNVYQKRNGAVIYPSEVMGPTGIRGMESNFTERTISIHHSELSWVSDEEKESLKQYQVKIMNRIGKKRENDGEV